MVKTKLVGLMPVGSFSTGRSLSELAPVIGSKVMSTSPFPCTHLAQLVSGRLSSLSTMQNSGRSSPVCQRRSLLPALPGGLVKVFEYIHTGVTVVSGPAFWDHAYSVASRSRRSGMNTCCRRWGGVGVAVRVRRKSVRGALRIVLNKREA